ncbi:hypothetical protein V9W64_10825 [Neisseria leonii]|uniref:Uncharacterized protein n=1 Tax=Neisseria leonii TaxID=2995413 RepID=A0A9X4DZI4_9NEIS|nr:hypothetical protein [Neisseria sp. 51.81]MDD9326735.1 hypothetical protein [Neisseria sp. 51.81]
MAKQRTTEEFIRQALEVHKGRYRYDKAEYKGYKAKVLITCPVHGDFLQNPVCHLQGQGCWYCRNESIGKAKRDTPEQFLEKARKKYGDRYDYSKVRYTGTMDEVTVICPTHGEFKKKPNKFLQGQGCQKCAEESVIAYHTQSKEELINRCREKHGDKYDYSLIPDRVKSADKVTISCPLHDTFEQTLVAHYSGQGCPDCARARIGAFHKKPKSEFVKLSYQVHGEKYDYGQVLYLNSKIPVRIRCPGHGWFSQRPNDHLDGHGCPSCAQNARGGSKANDDFLEFVASLAPDLIREARISRAKGEKRWRSDGFIPSHRLHLEFNGLIWHSTRMKLNPKIHTERMALAAKNGSRMLFIHEDEWLHHPHRVKHLLTHVLGKAPKVGARTCKIGPVDGGTAKTFYNRYHIQGCLMQPEVSYGLYKDGELVACMSFNRKTSNRKSPYRDGRWELVRFASKKAVTGGGSKLFKHFIRQHSPGEVVSFSMNHLFTGRLYEKLGFVPDKDLPPDYTYVDIKNICRLHKSGFQHSRLKNRLERYDPNLTEEENCRNHGWYRIYDCGKKRWIWKGDHESENQPAGFTRTD